VQRPLVKNPLATTILAFALLEGAAALAGELPAFEASSFPATPLQVAVMGSAGVQEQAATPTLARDGMPASPHQLSVLTPHHRKVSAADQGTVGAARGN
jgi:hypothetical protein